MPDHAHWLTDVFEPRRAALTERLATATRQYEEAHDRYQQLTDDGNRQIEEIEATTTVADDDATEVEYLTARATQTDRDLLVANLELAASQSWLEVRRLGMRKIDLDFQVWQAAALVEVGPIAAGNETQLDIIMIDVEEAAAEHALAVADLDRARRRLDATKRLHKEVHAALRAAKRRTRDPRPDNTGPEA